MTSVTRGTYSTIRRPASGPRRRDRRGCRGHWRRFAISTIGVASLRFIDPPPSPPPRARFPIRRRRSRTLASTHALSDGAASDFTAGMAGANSATLWVRDLESLEARRCRGPRTRPARSLRTSGSSRFRTARPEEDRGRRRIGAEDCRCADDCRHGRWNRTAYRRWNARARPALSRWPVAARPVPLTSINESQADDTRLSRFFRIRSASYVILSGREGGRRRVCEDRSTIKPDQDSGARLLRVTLGPLAVVDHVRAATTVRSARHADVTAVRCR